MRNTNMTRMGMKTLLVLVLLLTHALATASESENAATRAQLSLNDLRTFTDVFNQVRRNFVEDLDDHELMNAAIRGMLSELDPHSSFMEAGEFRQLDNSSRGRYSGIGVELSIQNNDVKVVFVMEGGAADKAGLVAGDVITSIDQTDLRGQNMQVAVDNLRGEVGTTVEITVRHENGEVSNLELVRDFVEVASVFSRPVDMNYGYFQVTHFTRKSADELLEQIEYMQDNLKGSLKGIVLDLRNNTGGVLTPAVAMADGFLDKGLIVSMRGRAEDQQEYNAEPGQWLEGVPVVVLVNRSTASASEVLAGALQDHGRALIIGEKTFGKGSVQSILNLRNGSGLRLTTARYYTPNGRSIQAEGIIPDVKIEMVQLVENDDPRKREADLDGHLTNESGGSPEVFDSEVGINDDYVMHQALIMLKASNILSSTR